MPNFDLTLQQNNQPCHKIGDQIFCSKTDCYRKQHNRWQDKKGDPNKSAADKERYDQRGIMKDAGDGILSPGFGIKDLKHFAEHKSAAKR